MMRSEMAATLCGDNDRRAACVLPRCLPSLEPRSDIVMAFDDMFLCRRLCPDEVML